MSKITVERGEYVPGVLCLCKRDKADKNKNTIMHTGYEKGGAIRIFECHHCFRRYYTNELTTEALEEEIKKTFADEAAKKADAQEHKKGKHKKQEEISEVAEESEEDNEDVS